MQCVTILIVSALLFIGFMNFSIKSNKVINTISTTMFGVYLIHDNDYIRQFLWVNVFKNSSYSESIFLIPYSIGVICFVFVVCICVELIRIYLVEKKYMKFINSAESVLIKKFRAECGLEKE